MVIDWQKIEEMTYADIRGIIDTLEIILEEKFDDLRRPVNE